MNTPTIKTFGELKKSGYKPKSIRDELRSNLLQKISKGERTFEGIHGFDETVIPELERAILSRHHINLLGLRGQAKTRLARMMVNLLDEWIPFIEGSEVNDDPFVPLSYYGRTTLAEKKDSTPIAWLHRDNRFFEKLATPDVTIADLIGDVDPIKAANLKLSYSDERVIHFGMIPRANRCIFVINELPDLQARIQVALFNILQEGDIQIRGFQLRFNFDIQFVFTANPEDYTNRGSIVTPLKDRIGSQILTHYPETIAIAQKITEQEAKLDEAQKKNISITPLAMELIEQIGFEARKSEYIDTKSGISARMSISAFENLVSSAELRMARNKQKKTSVRLSDFSNIVPALTGKMEMAYEGEQEGARKVAHHIIGAAVKSLFERYFPKVPKLEKQTVRGIYQDLIDWFVEQDEDFSLGDTLDDNAYRKKLNSIPALNAIVEKYQPDAEGDEKYFFAELILWGLVESKKLSRIKVAEGVSFRDEHSDFLKNM
ncbi:MAG TPA: magnesium chelatase [Bacteroidia bacterium]|jgi:magnesium chelatase subunit I